MGLSFIHSSKKKKEDSLIRSQKKKKARGTRNSETSNGQKIENSENLEMEDPP